MNKQQIWREKIKTFFWSIFFLIMVVIIGTSGYMFLYEKLSFVDALYMTVITITTVGFQEVYPLKPIGKIFTIVLILISFGIFGYLASTITSFILDGVFRRNLKDYKTVKKIGKLKNHVIVVGFGRNGRQASLGLLRHGETVVVIDPKESAIEQIRAIPDLLPVQGDATLEEVLEMAKISEAKALITATPSDAENVYVVLTAREMNPSLRIISRSSNSQSDNKLKRAGANNVIMPDRLGGQHMAKLVAQPDIVEFLDNILLQSPESVNLEEISCEDLSGRFVGASIKNLNVRNRSGANIIGLRNEDGSYIYNPSAELVLNNKQHLFVLGNKQQIKSLKEILTNG